MTRKQLAARLLAAQTEKERMNLLVGHSGLADVRLAWIIKDLSYTAWTSVPTDCRKASLAARSIQKFNPTAEVGAISQWLSAISEFTKGKFDLVIEHLEAAHREFTRLGKHQDASQTSVAKLMALAMLGRYDEALKTGELALKVFKRHGDDLAAGKIEMNLSNIVARREEYQASINYCRSARKRFTRLGELKWLAMAQNDLGRSYAELNDFRKAEKYYEQALETAQRGKMSLTEAEIEASMGNLALFRGRYAEASQIFRVVTSGLR